MAAAKGRPKLNRRAFASPVHRTQQLVRGGQGCSRWGPQDGVGLGETRGIISCGHRVLTVPVRATVIEIT